MIEREYFIRAKSAHNNGTGKYSWWSGVMSIKSITKRDGAFIYNQAELLARQAIADEYKNEGVDVSSIKIEIESLNRI